MGVAFKTQDPDENAPRVLRRKRQLSRDASLLLIYLRKEYIYSDDEDGSVVVSQSQIEEFLRTYREEETATAADGGAANLRATAFGIRTDRRRRAGPDRPVRELARRDRGRPAKPGLAVPTSMCRASATSAFERPSTTGAALRARGLMVANPGTSVRAAGSERSANSSTRRRVIDGPSSASPAASNSPAGCLSAGIRSHRRRVAACTHSSRSNLVRISTQAADECVIARVSCASVPGIRQVHIRCGPSRGLDRGGTDRPSPNTEVRSGVHDAFESDATRV
jgi:hypothetical protein